jgi:hypothetical protein
MEECNDPNAARNTLLLRHYNDGKHGGWDNYCCYKGNAKGHFVNATKTHEAVTEKIKEKE